MYSEIIIFGYKHLGQEIARQLSIKNDNFIIASNDMVDFKKAQKDELNAYYLEDITDDKELIKLGITENIKYIFCVSEDESNNIFLTISARALDENLKIIAEAETIESKKKFELAGANKVIDPYEISANRIFSLIKKPQIIDILDNTVFSKEIEDSINLAEINITKNSKLDGVYLNKIDLNSFNLIAIGVIDREKGEDFKFLTDGYNPKLDDKDVLIVVGNRAKIEEFKSYVKV